MHRVLVLAALLAPVAAHAAQGDAVAEIAACVQRNLPEPDTVRAVRIVSQDRAGSERVTIAKVYGHRTEDGLRRVLVRVTKPEELAGSSFLMLERADGAELYVRTSDDEKPKRITMSDRSLSLFGSDFTYEDFEYVQAFRRPGESKRLEDEAIQDRSVYVVEIRPAKEENSAYEKVRTFVDKESCLAIRMEFYETGPKLRKLFTVYAPQIRKRGDLWIAQMAMIKDLRDFTTTQLFVDSTDQDVLLDQELFAVPE